jgi:enoyl-CoA hydratase
MRAPPGDPMYRKLKLSVQHHIAQVQLCAPEQHNAFDEELHGEFSRALAALRVEPDIRVVLLHAQGSTFSAGGNFDFIRRLRLDPVLRRRMQQEGHTLATLLHDMPLPLVVAMQGHAMGLGATIVTSCDVVVAYKDAKLGDPHVQAGLVAGDGGVMSWSAAAGVTRAKRMLLTGQSITAQEAYSFGLVTDLVDTPEAAFPAAHALAEWIASLPPIAVQGTKRAFNALERGFGASALEIGLIAEMLAVSSDDLLEALDAIAQKRKGNFANR